MADCVPYHNFREWARGYLQMGASGIPVPRHFRQTCGCAQSAPQVPEILGNTLVCSGCRTQLYAPMPAAQAA